VSITAERVRSPTGELAATRYGLGERVLLVLFPLGEERKGSVRPASLLCRRLLDRGWSSLLFDYAGTGESPGDFAGVTWASVLADAAAALDKAWAWHETPVTLLAVRLGARVALELCHRGAGRIRRVCFWEPVLDARAWLRETERRSRFRLGGKAGATGDLDGYVFGPELRTALESMERWEPGRVQVPSIIFSVGARTQPTRALASLAENLGAEPRMLALPPFWLESDVVDWDPLLDATLEALD